MYMLFSVPPLSFTGQRDAMAAVESCVYSGLNETIFLQVNNICYLNDFRFFYLVIYHFNKKITFFPNALKSN